MFTSSRSPLARLSTSLILFLLFALNLAGATSAAPRSQPLGPGRHQSPGEAVSPQSARTILSSKTHTAGAINANAAEITPLIQSIADGLDKNPGLLFDLVHNHIEYVPTFGSMNGATATFEARRGNDWDQAALLIALLRASGITANFVEGDVTYSAESVSNWLGVATSGDVAASILSAGGVPNDFTANPNGVKLTRVWVEAEIEGQTVTLDPAFKRHTVFEKIPDFGSLLQYDRAAFLTRAQAGASSDANSIQNVNETNLRADLNALSANLHTALASSHPTSHIHEIIGGATIIQSTTQDFGTTLPEALNVENESRFGQIPASRKHTLRIEHAGIDQTFATHEIANRKLTISYDGGNAPLLKIDGSPVMTGTATTPNTFVDLKMTIDHPYAAQGGLFGDQSGTLSLLSGSPYAILHDFGGISEKVLRSRDPRMRQISTRTRVTAEEAILEALHLIGLNYALQDRLFTHLASQMSDVRFLRHHLLGVVGQESNFQVDVPFSFVSTTPLTPGADSDAAFRTLVLMSSAFEHGVLEQTQGSTPEAVSTIKLMQKSNAAGQKTFLTNGANFATVKPQLTNYEAGTMARIESAIDGGSKLVLPADGAIEVNQFRGVGYVVDFRVGNGVGTSMKISGGLFGGQGTTSDVVDPIRSGLNQPNSDSYDKYRSVISLSGEPVEMANGDYILERQDLVVGDEAPLGLAFERFYSSGRSHESGPLGAGWIHSFDSTLTAASNGPIALGLGQPQDVVPILVYLHVSLDLVGADPTLPEWMVGVLSARWAMDQLTDNARAVILDNRSRTFVRRPDGSFNTPAGAAERLIESGSGARIEDPMGQLYFFDTAGRLGARIDRNGNTMSYTYDPQGRLTGVESAFGDSFSFTYDGEGRISSLTDSAGRTVGYGYDNKGNLTAVTDPGGNVWAYEYDNLGRMTRVMQAIGSTRGNNNPVMTNTYDEFGRVIRQFDGASVTTRFGWTDFRNRELYLNGAQRIHHYDGQGRLTGLEDAAGKRSQIEVDGRGYVRAITDKLGGVQRYDFDLDAGQVTKLTDPAGQTETVRFAVVTQSIPNPLVAGQTIDVQFSQRTGIDYADGTSESYQRDGRGNLVQISDRNGASFGRTYNARGQITGTTNPSGGTGSFVYNANGTLRSTQNSDVDPTLYTYDNARRLTRIDYPDGSNEQFAYDANDRLIQSTDGNGNLDQLSYDPAGNMVRLVQGVGSELELTFTLQFDVLDRLIRLVDPEGNASRYTYTFFGALDRAIYPDDSAFDLDYDGRERVQRITLPTGETITVEQNDEGQLAGLSLPSGRNLKTSSDARGLYTGLTDALGNSYSLTRNPVGRIVQFKDRLNNRIDFEYDGEGRLIGVTTPVVGTTRYLRDGLGALTEIRTLSGSQWQFSNTSMGRRTGLTDPLGNQWQYAYDSSGRLSLITHPDGETESLTYDGNDNVTRRAFSGGLTLDYAYDSLDRLSATGSEAVDIEYDKRSKVTGTTMHGIKVETSYDEAGRITQLTYGTILNVGYSYDEQGRLFRVADSISGGRVSYAYDVDGLVSAIDRSNGVRTTFTRDANGRITRIAHGDLGSVDVDYDAEENVLKLIEALPDDASSILAQNVQRYLFDAADQIDGPDFRHDARGRRLTDGRRTYGWDRADRLISYTEENRTTQLSYTALGETASRTISGQEFDFLYAYSLSRRPLIAEVQNGTMVRAYVYAPGGALLYFVDVPAARPFFYHFNQVGSTLFLTDKDGQVSDVYGYSVFGQQKSHTGPNGDQLFTFVGEYGVRREGESGLYQMGARYYDSETLRFISREPRWPLLGLPQALNPYQYAFNNPASLIDPTGFIPETPSGRVHGGDGITSRQTGNSGKILTNTVARGSVDGAVQESVARSVAGARPFGFVDNLDALTDEDFAFDGRGSQRGGTAGSLQQTLAEFQNKPGQVHLKQESVDLLIELGFKVVNDSTNPGQYFVSDRYGASIDRNTVKEILDSLNAEPTMPVEDCYFEWGCTPISLVNTSSDQSEGSGIRLLFLLIFSLAIVGLLILRSRGGKRRVHPDVRA